jgi:aerobic-type carbon monoxide dehydrogenase small subunit (CoxS/CutS family)
MPTVRLHVNGAEREVQVAPRDLLLDVLRGSLGLTSVHAACEQGPCGACTVLVDGVTVRSCLMFGVQADGAMITTVEGLAAAGDDMHPIQEAFSECHALQCGFCTPAMVLTVVELLQRDPMPDRVTIEDALAGQLCRCTGYESIIDAVQVAATRLAGQEATA